MSTEKKTLISVFCLIYKSTRWLQFLYDQFKKYTFSTDKYNVEFYFVANDANEKVLQYLKNHNIPHFDYKNTFEQQKQYYMCNVYRAYNFGVHKANGEYVLLLNSDMAFSPNWLDRLWDKLTEHNCVCSRLVESGRYDSGKYGISKNFGHAPDNYREQAFVDYVKSISKDEIHNSGLYGPLLIKKNIFESVKGYPEGNILHGSDIWNPVIPTQRKKGVKVVPGDITFMAKLKERGIQHQTVFNSIVYHFQEGEKHVD